MGKTFLRMTHVCTTAVIHSSCALLHPIIAVWCFIYIHAGEVLHDHDDGEVVKML